MVGILRKSVMIPLTQFVSALITGAMELLIGETQGYAIDATVIGNRSFIGGPDGGKVACRDTSTPANDLSNVPLDLSNLTQSGTSAKIVVWNDGTVRWTPHNKTLQSQTFDNAAWTKTAVTITANDIQAPDGTLTADKAVESNTSTSLTAEASSVGVVSGVIYTVQAYVRASNIQFFFLNFGDTAAGTNGVGKYFDLTSVAIGTTATAGTGWTFVAASCVDAGNGWRICTLTVTTGATTSFMTARSATADNSTTRVTTGTYWLWGAQRNRGFIATPYLVTTTAADIGIPQGYGANAVLFGMLVEPAATNLALQSQTFDSATWTKVTCSVTLNVTTAPDGSSTADKLIEDATSTLHNLSQAVTVVSGTVYTWSVYAKAAERTRVGIYSFDSTFAAGYATEFDVSTGTVANINGSIGTGTYVGNSITSIGNGWYRCSVSGSVPFTAALLNIYLETAAGASNYPGDGTSGLYLWGAQMEVGTVATSHIPTVASTVTRARDNISALTSTIPLSTSAGTLFLDCVVLEPVGAYSAITIDDGTATNSIGLYWDSGEMNMFNEQGGTPNVNALLGGLNYLDGTSRTQISYAFATNDYDGSVNGLAPQTDAAGTLASGITTIRIGCDQTTTGPILVYRVVYVPRQVQADSGNLVSWRYNYPP